MQGFWRVTIKCVNIRVIQGVPGGMDKL